MAVGPIITMGYGATGSTSLILTLGYVTSEVEPPTHGSLEWTLPESRLHWKAAGKPLHWNTQRTPLHWSVEK